MATVRANSDRMAMGRAIATAKKAKEKTMMMAQAVMAACTWQSGQFAPSLASAAAAGYSDTPVNCGRPSDMLTGASIH